MSFATLSRFGTNAPVIWRFAGGVLAILLVIALVLAGVAMIRRLVSAA